MLRGRGKHAPTDTSVDLPLGMVRLGEARHLENPFLDGRGFLRPTIRRTNPASCSRAMRRIAANIAKLPELLAKRLLRLGR